MLNDVPISGQSLSSSRSLIQANFIALNTAFTVDHVQYNDGSGNQGKHNRVSFPVQSPAPTFASGEEGLYNFLNPTTAKNELYVHKQSGVTTSNIPLTASTLSSNATPASLSSYWTYIPSGIIEIKGNASGSGLITVTFSGAGIPTLTQVLDVKLQITGSTTDTNTAVAFVDTPSVGTFRVFVSSRTATGAAAGSFTYTVKGY